MVKIIYLRYLKAFMRFNVGEQVGRNTNGGIVTWVVSS